MDSRTLSKATGTPAGTINAWIQRGYVRDMDVEVSGRRRNFSPEQATHIAIMAELTRFGFGAVLATAAAYFAARYSCSLIVNPHQEGPIDETGHKIRFSFTPFESEEKLPEAVAEAAREAQALGAQSLREALPSVYIVINAARVAAKMHLAEEEWQRQRKARAKRKADG